VSRASVAGKDLKALVTALTRFPSIGAFAGSELIHFRVGKGFLQASSMGVVISRARIQAKGQTPCVAVDSRALGNFTSGFPDNCRVTIDVDENSLAFSHNDRQIKTALIVGQQHSIPKMMGVEGVIEVDVTAEIAERVGYLAGIAYNDNSRPEVNCVLLAGDGRAMAMNQKAVAVLKCHNGGVSSRVALPVPLAQVLVAGDMVWAGPKETVVRSGICRYCMPTPTKAQKSFPVESIDQFAKTEREVVCTCNGQQLKDCVSECSSILSQLARTEVVVSLTIGPGKLELFAKNAGVEYRGAVGLKTSKLETDLTVPLEEMTHIAQFLPDEVTLSRGKNGETFVSCKDGWAMVPRFKPGK
jgi:hypothetical protein